ncbi:MAG: cupin domain-containing protein [Polaromonas sp.]|nr:cupin domain-containing protein [Polaromonas sp.]
MSETSPLPILRATQLITQLQLQPHPEGGWYREVFRSKALVQRSDARQLRPALTSIYFLLEADQYSRWHKVMSDEAWVYLEGLPLDLWSWDSSSGQVSHVQLGPVKTMIDDSNPNATEAQCVIAAGLWQAAQPQAGPADSFTLVACMVGPGFDFSDFEMMRTDSHEAQQIASIHPRLAHFI